MSVIDHTPDADLTASDSDLTTSPAPDVTPEVTPDLATPNLATPNLATLDQLRRAGRSPLLRPSRHRAHLGRQRVR